jgi:cytochrome c5
MRLGTRLSLARPLLALALTIALVALGMGHRYADPAQSAALEAYALAGGDISGLCGGADGKAMAGGHCPVCHVAGAMMLPDPALPVQAAVFGRYAEVTLPPQAAVRAVARDPANGLRAPPLA